VTRSAAMLGLLRGLAGERDSLPGRGGVDCLQHSLQVAARAVGDLELRFVALVHDACRVICPAEHGTAVAVLAWDRLSPGRFQVLRSHSAFQADLLDGGSRSARFADQPWYPDAQALAGWDAASFDPDADPPDLDAFVPLVERFLD